MAKVKDLDTKESHLEEIVKKFDPKGPVKSTPGERRELVEAGLAKEVHGTVLSYVLTEEGRKILYAHYRAEG